MTTQAQHQENRIPEQTIEVFARSFFREAALYGFGRLDFIRFVNQLLDYSMDRGGMSERLTVEYAPRASSRPEQVTRPGQFHGPCSTCLPIEGKRVSILPYHPDQHRNLIRSWLRDRHGRHFMLSRTTSRTVDFDELANGEGSLFGVVTLPDGKAIGSVAYLDFDPVQCKAELRKLIGDPGMRGRGLAREATELWIRYGIHTLGLRKIYLNTLQTNIRNIKLNEELGFKFEGILRNEVFFDNAYHDVLRMALWRE